MVHLETVCTGVLTNAARFAGTLLFLFVPAAASQYDWWFACGLAEASDAVAERSQGIIVTQSASACVVRRPFAQSCHAGLITLRTSHESSR